MYRYIISWIRNNFGFSRTEANAYMVLLALLITAHFVASRNAPPRTEIAEPEYLDSLWKAFYSIEDTVSPATYTFRVFDPNISSYDSLVGMGIPAFVASNIVKYRDAGGHFKNPDDLKKLYGMTDSLWSEISPWIKIRLPQKGSVKKQTYQRSPVTKDTSISMVAADLNTVDSIWLMQVRGIGPVLSKRIIKYRELLGGFHSISQLKEVYRLPPEVIQTLEQHVFIDLAKSPVKKINLNQLNSLQIASHPYFSYSQAKAIESYRNQHGQFEKPEQLKNLHLIDDSTYLRVSPYIVF